MQFLHIDCKGLHSHYMHRKIGCKGLQSLIIYTKTVKLGVRRGFVMVLQ